MFGLDGGLDQPARGHRPAGRSIDLGLLWRLKENIRVEGKRDIHTKVMTTLFLLFVEIERDLIC